VKGAGGEKIRVAVRLELEVDRELYQAEYGEPASVQEIRDHVKGESAGAVEMAFAHLSSVRIVGWK
jgi:hypothetical protein